MIIYSQNLDIDDCASNPCHGNATCNNTIGSFICTCDDGFSGDGFNCSGKENQLGKHLSRMYV